MTPAHTDSPDDIRAFIAGNLPLAPAPGIAEIRLHQAQPQSALWRLAAVRHRADTPFWAYAWAGGLALARHVLTHPESVRGRRVIDFGAGSGLVAIAAAKAGAASVTAVDIDPAAQAAAALNAEANGVVVTCTLGDITREAPPDADVILVGDVFYDRALAKQVLPFLQRCAGAGLAVLIGDPNRAPLPRNRLRRIAHYETRDVGQSALTTSHVFALHGG